MQRALLAGLCMFAASSFAAETPAEIERRAATYYVESCQSDITSILQSESYYADKDVPAILATFDNKTLAGEFLGSLERHRSMDDTDPVAQQRRASWLAKALAVTDSAKRCVEVGRLYNVYRTMGEAQENIVARKGQQNAANTLAAHDKDPVTVDYSVAASGIGQTGRQNRPAKGVVRKLTLGQYIKWEADTSGKWKGQLWNAFGTKNKNIVYNQCLETVRGEWVTSFGYPDAVLRSSLFNDGVVGLDKVLRIVCMPG